LDVHPLSHLPRPPTSLVGREREVAELCALLRRDDARLVTLTGPGGVGKTRLGLQVAAELVEGFPDGVWFVSLSRLSDPALVIPTIAQTLGLQEAGSQPVHGVLQEWARSQRLLLLLDNCEQVAEAAPAVADLLAYCPGLKVLATSRVMLRLQGEREYPIAPLALPPVPPGPLASGMAGAGGAGATERPLSPEQLAASPAVALFVARAQAHRPDFQLTTANAAAVVEICARLDGLPLALDLAAARLKLLMPKHLLARLEPRLPLLTGGARDLEDRQRTMQNTLAWSEGLLAPEERRLFRRLAVFAGGFTLEAAEAVCDAPAGAAQLGMSVLEGLEALVDQSLVQPRRAGSGDAERGDEEAGGDARFRLLYVVREYALERLKANDAGDAGHEEEALRYAHAAYYVGLADRAWAIAHGEAADYAAVLAESERLALEEDNLRAALGWLRARAEEERPPGRAGRLQIARQGQSTLPVARSASRPVPGGVSPLLAGLRLAGALVWMWSMLGHLSEGRAWLEALLALDLETADHAAQAVAASAPSATPPNVPAQPNRPGADAADGIRRAVRGRALYALGVLTHWQGDTEQAIPLLERSLALARALGDSVAMMFALKSLGMALHDQGDLERARACYEESIAVGRALAGSHSSLGLSAGVGDGLWNLARLAFDAGDLEQAETYAEEALTLCRRVHYVHAAASILLVQTLIAWRQGHLRQAEALAREALALFQAARDVRYYGDVLEVHAIISAALGQGERAARLLGAAAAYRERIGMRGPKGLPVTLAGAIASGAVAARTALGEGQWAAAYAAGQARSLEEAIADALGTDEVDAPPWRQ
jgi:predicted ATPase